MFPQLGRHGAGDIVLDGQDIGELAVVLIAPEIMICVGVDEFGADDELIAALHDASGDHAIDFQIAGDGLRIEIMPLVAKDGGAGHNGQMRNLGKLVDQAFG